MIDLKEKKFLTLSEYAKWRGVTNRAVLKAVRSNRLDGCWSKIGKAYAINKEKADHAWVANADPSKMHLVKKRPDEGDNDIELKDFGKVPDNKYNTAKAVKETFNAKLAQLEYEEKIGKLISKELIEKIYFEKARKIRDGLLNIPSRIMDKVAAETDPYICEQLMVKECNLILQEISDDIKRLSDIN